MRWQMAMHGGRRLRPDGSVLAAAITGALWALAGVVAFQTRGPVWARLTSDQAIPLTLAAALCAALAHGGAYVWVRRRGWWALLPGVMGAGALSGLLSGGLAAGTTMVLAPALLGYPSMRHLMFDIQPPYTTPVAAAVTLWAMAGMGAAAGGGLGLLGGALGCPAVLPVWILLLWREGRRRQVTDDAAPELTATKAA